jgi:hypothetical protein
VTTATVLPVMSKNSTEYSRWLPDNSLAKLVDVLDDAAPRGPQVGRGRAEVSMRSTFALRASAGNLRMACQPKLTRMLASVSEGW